jgi:hypothetical protein
LFVGTAAAGLSSVSPPPDAPAELAELQEDHDEYTAEMEHPKDYEWAAIEGRTMPAKGRFVAQVMSESMNRRVSNGAWCLWRLRPSG